MRERDDCDASSVSCSRRGWIIHRLFVRTKLDWYRISFRHCIENVAKSSRTVMSTFVRRKWEKIKIRLLKVFSYASSLQSSHLPILKMKFYCSDFLTVFWLTYSLYSLTWGIRSPHAKFLVDTFPLNISMNSILCGPNLLIHKNFIKMSWSPKFTL